MPHQWWCLLSQLLTSQHVVLIGHCNVSQRIILLRTPKIFKYVWSFVRPFLDQNVQDSVIITTQSDYLDVLQKYIELEDLPPCIASQGQAGGMKGYFEKVSLKGGPLQKHKPAKTAPMLVREESTTSVATSASSSTSISSRIEMPGTTTTNVSASVLMRGFWIGGSPDQTMEVQ